MKKWIITALALAVAAPAAAQECTRTEAYAACATYIERQATAFIGSTVPPEYNYRDEGATHWLQWNRRYPIYVATGHGGKRKTGAVCEVEKQTGRIVYLAVSAREIIK